MIWTAGIDDDTGEVINAVRSDDENWDEFFDTMERTGDHSRPVTPEGLVGLPEGARVFEHEFITWIAWETQD